MSRKKVMLITGARKGIGRYLAEHYESIGFEVVGCSREPSDFTAVNYNHFCLDVADEKAVLILFSKIRKDYGCLDVLLNNAGVASMNHVLLTPLSSVQRMMETNISGTFLFCREAAKIMRRNKYGRIVNFSTVAVPLKIEGEAIYAATKAAIASFTQILAHELADFGITVNAVGPTPIKTDLVSHIPEEKMAKLIDRQAIKRWGEFRDISNLIDFFIQPESDFITGQVVYLGGIS